MKRHDEKKSARERADERDALSRKRANLSFNASRPEEARAFDAIVKRAESTGTSVATIMRNIIIESVKEGRA